MIFLLLTLVLLTFAEAVKRDCDDILGFLNSTASVISTEEFVVAYQSVLFSSLVYLPYNLDTFDDKARGRKITPPNRIQILTEDYLSSSTALYDAKRILLLGYFKIKWALEHVSVVMKEVVVTKLTQLQLLNGTKKTKSIKTDITPAPNASSAKREREYNMSASISRSLIIPEQKESFDVTWFFNDFRDGQWHDTEALIAESAETVLIVFRGSESARDVITNSQRLEPTWMTSQFQAVKGRIHRGMLHAYANVHEGDIIRVRETDTPSLFDGAALGDTFRGCAPFSSPPPDPHHSHHNKTTTKKCKVKNVQLSYLLKDSINLAIDAGKQVVVTGHSLGAALSLIFALDVMLNANGCTHKKKAKTTRNNSLLGQLKQRLAHKLQRHPIQSMSAALSSNYFNINNHTSSGKDYSNGYNDLDTCDYIRDYSRLHLITFGEPQFTDLAFFDSVFDLSPLVKRVFTSQYRRFISLSQSPRCERDMVTDILQTIGDIVGHKAVGLRAYYMNHTDSQDDQEESEAAAVASSCIDIHSPRNGAKSSSFPPSSSLSPHLSDQCINCDLDVQLSAQRSVQDISVLASSFDSEPPLKSNSVHSVDLFDRYSPVYHDRASLPLTPNPSDTDVGRITHLVAVPSEKQEGADSFAVNAVGPLAGLMNMEIEGNRGQREGKEGGDRCDLDRQSATMDAAPFPISSSSFSFSSPSSFPSLAAPPLQLRSSSPVSLITSRSPLSLLSRRRYHPYNGNCRDPGLAHLPFCPPHASSVENPHLHSDRTIAVETIAVPPGSVKDSSESMSTALPLLRQRQILLCSGSADSSLDAHSLTHYLHGLLFAALHHKDTPRRQNRRRRRARKNLGINGPAAAATSNSSSSPPSSHLPIHVQTDIEPAVAQFLGWLPLSSLEEQHFTDVGGLASSDGYQVTVSPGFVLR